jgi:hypothetical protein
MTITEIPKDVKDNFAKYIVFREITDTSENYQTSLTDSLEKIILMLTGYLVFVEKMNDKALAEQAYKQMSNLLKFYQFLSQKLLAVESEEIEIIKQPISDILKLIKKIQAKLRRIFEEEIQDALSQHSIRTFSEVLNQQKI